MVVQFNQRRSGDERRRDWREGVQQLTVDKARLDGMLKELSVLLDNMEHAEGTVSPIYWRERLADIVQRGRGTA
jgi:hypothetical protein